MALSNSRYSTFKKALPSILLGNEFFLEEVYDKIELKFPSLITNETCSHEEGRKDFEWQHDVRKAQYHLKERDKVIGETEDRKWFLVSDKYLAIFKSRGLKKYQFYTRQEIHDIFSPQTKYINSQGGWHSAGINKVPDTEHDYVFHVNLNYDNDKGSYFDHEKFPQSVNSEGYVEWASQPGQELNDNQIKDLIKTNDTGGKIYYFIKLKSAKNQYLYLGNLKYIRHDIKTSKPVYFTWKLLDWEPNDKVNSLVKEIQERNSLRGISESRVITDVGDVIPRNGKPIAKRRNKGIKMDWMAHAKELKEIGDGGELWVVEYLRHELRENGCDPDLVVHSSNLIGDGLGYDIESISPDNEKIFIEVKTTTGTDSTSFFVSPREIEISKENVDKYYLYIVFNYDKEKRKGELRVLKGDLEKLLDLSPSMFRGKIAENG